MKVVHRENKTAGAVSPTKKATKVVKKPVKKAVAKKAKKEEAPAEEAPTEEAAE